MEITFNKANYSDYVLLHVIDTYKGGFKCIDVVLSDNSLVSFVNNNTNIYIYDK